MNIQILNLNANPSNIESGDQVTLTYKIDGNDQTNIVKSYSLDTNTNIYFETAPGQYTQQLPDEQDVLNNPPMDANKVVKLVRQPPKPSGANYTQFKVLVSVTDNVTHDSKGADIQMP